MKEDQFKNLIQKSSLETSDDFINSLMTTLEKKKVYRKKLIRKVFLSCSILIGIITFFSIKLLNNNELNFSLLDSIPKLPIFVVVVLVLLIYLNSFVRLSEQRIKKT